ncbi:hypothetical protein MN01_00164 [Escherichia phage MN01]|nr:hypothetical protein MN01_00164 [Escherichia phage MN01]
MKIITIIVLTAFFSMSIYWAIMTPHMIPTLILGWVFLGLQARYECFN